MRGSRRRARASIVGRDFARTRLLSRRRRLLPALLLGALISALGLAALRVDLIRVRYGLAEAMEREQELSESRARLTARVRALRDPAQLAQRARELGLSAPHRAVDLSALARSEP